MITTVLLHLFYGLQLTTNLQWLIKEPKIINGVIDDRHMVDVGQ
jgi:hypothetical protein